MKQEAIFADDSLMSEMIPSCLKSIAYLVWHSHIFDLQEEGSADMHILNLFCCTFRCVGQLITAFLYCEYNYHCYEYHYNYNTSLGSHTLCRHRIE